MSVSLFIDDSGSKLWDTPFAKDFIVTPPAHSPGNLKFWRDNYFVLAGAYLDSSLMKELNPLINEAKIQTFGTKYVEIHSSSLRNPSTLKKDYLKKFGVTLEQVRAFIDNFWYPLFAQYEIKLQAVVLDKRYYKHRRIDSTPLEIAVQAMFDRIERNEHKNCKIIFDQMDKQVAKLNTNQGQILKIANKTIDLKSPYNTYSHQTVSFENSRTSNFLQLADTVAYNIYRQFVDSGDKWRVGAENDFGTYQYFKRIYPNFSCHPKTGKVCGCGLVKLPDIYRNTSANKAQKSPI